MADYGYSSLNTNNGHPGFVKAMADISSKLEKRKEDAISSKLSGRDHWRHCPAVNKELYWIQNQTLLHKSYQVRVRLQEACLVVSQGNSCWAGEEEALHGSFMGGRGPPAVRQGAETFSVPRNPVFGK